MTVQTEVGLFRIIISADTTIAHLNLTLEEINY
jgi:hypothetical protein